MKNKSVLQSILTGLFVVLVLATSNSTVRAQSCTSTTTWNAGTSSWFNSLNWSNGIPDSTKCAYINNGGQAGVHGGNAVAQNIILGNSQNQSGLVTVDTDHTSILDAGTSSCRGEIYIGNAGSGTLSIVDTAYVRCRYAYVAAVSNPSRPASNGNVKVEGSGTVWYIYDNPSTCTGAGLFIGGTGSGGGGTGSVLLTGGGTIEVTNRANAGGVRVYGSGTLAGDGLVTIGGGTTALSKTAVVSGTLSPGSGALEIRGNLDLTPAGTSNTIFHVTPTTFDQLKVTQGTGGGVATLGGRITVIVTGTFSYFPRTFTLLHSDNGLNGTEFLYESITLPGGQCISADIQYDTNDVNLVLTSTCG
jgi:hypothetical protein